jgi:hypothetical protein
MGLSPAEMDAAVVRNLQERTGRDLDAWLAVLSHAPAGPASEQVRWLKAEHGLGHVTAQVVVRHAAGGFDSDAVRLERLFGPASDPRRALLAEVEAAVREASPSVRTTVCQGYVGYAGRRQFAVVRGRPDGVEVGLRLDPTDAGPAPTRGWGGGSITSSFVVVDRLTDEQRGWIRAAAAR